jgi:thiamine biosynthesis lipoprotein
VIESGGLATSSSAVRRWRHQGRLMHHIIDPRTSQPARTHWRTVSVAAADCTDANTGATAALIRCERAPAWLERVGLPARLVDWEGNVRSLAGWPT